MSLPLLIEALDIERAIGAQRFVQLTTTNATGRAPVSIVADILQVATDEAGRFLAPGFTPDEIVALARRDMAIRRKIAMVGVGVAAVGRPEFIGGDGKFVFQAAYDEARKDLMAIGNKDQRSAAEEQNGTINRTTGVRVGLRRNRATRHYVFADTLYRRGGGPF